MFGAWELGNHGSLVDMLMHIQSRAVVGAEIGNNRDLVVRLLEQGASKDEAVLVQIIIAI